MVEKDGTAKSDTPNEGKLAGKYDNPEALEKAYKELEGKLGGYDSLKQEHSDYKQFIEKVAPHYKMDPNSGEIGWNEPVLAESLKELGYSVTRGEDTQPVKEKEAVGEKEVTGKDLQKEIQSAIKTELGGLLEKHIQPLTEKIEKKEANDWVSEVSNRHADFEDHKDDILKLMKDMKIQVGSPDQLETLYHAAKGIKGGYIDRKAWDQEKKDLHTELAKTGQVFDPTGGFGGKQPAEATGKDLLGLPADFGKEHDDQSLSQVITGKKQEMLDPS